MNTSRDEWAQQRINIYGKNQGTIEMNVPYNEQKDVVKLIQVQIHLTKDPCKVVNPQGYPYNPRVTTYYELNHNAIVSHLQNQDTVAEMTAKC